MSYVATYNAFQISSISKAEHHVLTTICTFADRNTGVCWPTVETIANRCRSSVRTVQTHIKGLVKAGLVQRIYRPNRPAITKVLIPVPATSAPLEVQLLHPEPDIQPVIKTTSAAVALEAVSPLFLFSKIPKTPVAAVPDLVAAVPAVADLVAAVPAVADLVAAVPAVPDLVAAVPAVADLVAAVPAVADLVAAVPAVAVVEAVDPVEAAWSEVPASLKAEWSIVRKNKKKVGTPVKSELVVLAQEAAKAGLSVKDVILWCVLRGYSRFEASWVQHVPPQVQPGRDSVFKPEVSTPANPSTIAKFKEAWARQRAQILADSAQRREQTLARMRQ